MRFIRPAAVDIEMWNKECSSVAMDLAQDRRAWTVAVRDAVHAIDVDSARARCIASRVEVSAIVV